jgi:hypothetical protein
MDEPTKQESAQLELLAKIHNQLVDLKQIIVDIELSRTDTSHTLQTRLRQIIGSDQHLKADGSSGSPLARQQKVIAPTDTGITPGEAAK